MRPHLNRSSRPHRALRGAAALAGLCAVVLTSCSLPDSVDSPAAPPAEATPAPDPTVTWSADDGGTVKPGDDLRVRVTDGTLQALDVLDHDGKALPASVAADTGTVTDLPPGRILTVTVTSAGADGTISHAVRTIRTAAPEHPLKATVTPGDDATVGVGQPVVVTFNTAVDDRAAAERALSVHVDRSVGDAGWYWFNDTQVQYRPKAYWPTGTKVTVRAALNDVRTGKTTWGVRDTTSTFTVGRSQILKIDANEHMMTVLRNGKAVRSVPVSLGQHKGTWRTRSGVKTIMSIERTVRMDSATVGITGDGAYDHDVPYAMRLTWSGEYVHGAPWSEWAQGKQDVSHGCTNISLANAKWLFENSLVGDPVETAGTGRPMEPGNGWGGAWDVAWKDWKAGSALS